MDPKEPKNPILKILLADVEIFIGGALIALVIVAVIFGVLNYFNIISLSSIYEPFSLLPRRIKLISPNNNLYPQKSTRMPTALPPIPNKIKADVKSITGDILIPSYIPLNLFYVVRSIKNSDNSTSYSYSTSWAKKDEESFSVIVNYNQTQDITSEATTIYIPKVITGLDASSSGILTSQYIKINPQGIFACKNNFANSSLTLCESFWENKDGTKEGIGIISPIFINSNKSEVFYCERNQEDPNYSWKSCGSESPLE